MCLNECGRIAVQKWLESIEIRPNISLGEYIIMPDHMHGIISIDAAAKKVTENHTHTLVKANCIRPNDEKNEHHPEKKDECNSLRQPTLIGPSNTIGAIIRGYKGSVTKSINQYLNNQHNENPERQPIKIWQRNYYEHIIRNEKAYENISNYIINNPAKWTADRKLKGESHSPR